MPTDAKAAPKVLSQPNRKLPHALRPLSHEVGHDGVNLVAKSLLAGNNLRDAPVELGSLGLFVACGCQGGHLFRGR